MTGRSEARVVSLCLWLCACANRFLNGLKKRQRESAVVSNISDIILEYVSCNHWICAWVMSYNYHLIVTCVL